jgi:hypothetical protein
MLVLVGIVPSLHAAASAETAPKTRHVLKKKISFTTQDPQEGHHDRNDTYEPARGPQCPAI